MNAPFFQSSKNGHMSSEYWSETFPYVFNLLWSFCPTQILKTQEKVVCTGISVCWPDITKVVQAKILLFIFYFRIFLTSNTVQRAPLFFTVQNV